jgi:hypothetical protein
MLTIAALPVAWTPAAAAPDRSELVGTIRTSAGTPLEGARVLAADADRGEVHRSEPSGPDGGFTLSDLPPGTYDLAVQTDEGVWLVREPLYLVAGARRTLRIAVGEEPASGTGAPEQASPSVWNNPFSAGAIVLGAAIVVGALVKRATEDEEPATPVTAD